MNRFIFLLDRTRYITLASLLLLIPILIDIHIIVGAGPESKFRLFEYGVFLCAFLSIPIWLLRTDPIRVNIAVCSICALIAYLFFRAWFDSVREFALDTAFQTVAICLFALLVMDVCRHTYDFQRLIWIAVISQLFTIAYAVGETFGVDIYFQYIKGVDWRWQNELVDQARGIIWNTLGNPNYYASYGGVLLIFLITLLVLARRIWAKILLAVYAIILIYTLVYTFTRGIWVSLFFTTCVLFFLFFLYGVRQVGGIQEVIRHYGKRIFLISFSFVLLFSAVYGIESVRGHGPLHSVSKRFYHGFTFRDTSMRTRPLLWYAALKMWKEKPLWGQGHGRYSARFLETVADTVEESSSTSIQQITRNMNTIRANYTHNDYLHFLAELGAAGFAFILLAGVFILIPTLFILFLNTLSRKEKILLTGCLAVFLQTAFQCIYDFPLHLPASAIFFALAVGGILFFQMKSQRIEPAAILPFPIRWPFCLAVLGIFLLGFEMIPRHLAASHMRKDGRSHLSSEVVQSLSTAPQKAISSLRSADDRFSQASKLFPGDGEILYEKGRTFYYFSIAGFGPHYRRRAIEHLERAKETFCIPELYEFLGSVYIDEKGFALAQQQLDILLQVDPVRDEVQFLAGRIDELSNRYEEAAEHYRAELKHNPDHIRARGYLGMIYKNQFQHYEDAANQFEILLENNRNLPDIHEFLADIYANHLSRPLQARENYRKALAIAQNINDFTRVNRLQAKLKGLQDRLHDEER